MASSDLALLWMAGDQLIQDAFHRILLNIVEQGDLSQPFRQHKAQASSLGFLVAEHDFQENI